MFKDYNDFYRQSHRLRGFNYSSFGFYFITICAKKRNHYFGEIDNQVMRLSEMGKIARECRFEIPLHYPNVVLDEFALMPNHLHGLLRLTVSVTTQYLASKNMNKTHNVETTQNFASLQRTDNDNRFGPQSENLSSIIRGFKIGVKKYATINRIEFFWQSKFFDRIVRHEDELNRIREYIRNNPLNWKQDRNNQENLFI